MIPHLRLNMYCAPRVKKCERSSLSSLSIAGALCATCQFMVWSKKSYSNQKVPPEPCGKSEAVPTSKTPQPQAQAQLGLGVKTKIRNARTSPSVVFLEPRTRRRAQAVILPCRFRCPEPG